MSTDTPGRDSARALSTHRDELDTIRETLETARREIEALREEQDLLSDETRQVAADHRELNAKLENFQIEHRFLKARRSTSGRFLVHWDDGTCEILDMALLDQQLNGWELASTKPQTDADGSLNGLFLELQRGLPGPTESLAYVNRVISAEENFQNQKEVTTLESTSR